MASMWPNLESEGARTKMSLYDFFHGAVIEPIVDQNRDALKSVAFDATPKEYFPIGRAVFELGGELYSLELRKEAQK